MLFVIASLNAPVGAQEAAPKTDRFAPLRFLAGTWRGDQAGQPGKGTAERTFRASWPYSPLSARKRLEYLRSFFRFCHDAGWTDRNPAMAVKASKVEESPTLPFQR
jgi:hypothetical protein